MQKKLIKRREANAVDKYVGLRVRNRRLQVRLTQSDIGAALGLSFQQIRKYENGTNRISASNLFRIAAALGVDIAYFFAGMSDETAKAGLAAQPTPPASSPDKLEHDPLQSPESVKFALDFQRIADPRIRKQVSKFVKALANPG